MKNKSEKFEKRKWKTKNKNWEKEMKIDKVKWKLKNKYENEKNKNEKFKNENEKLECKLKKKNDKVIWALKTITKNWKIKMKIQRQNFLKTYKK